MAPPEDFDPNTASHSDLIRHGILWRRPTEADHPSLRAAWKKVFSRKWIAEDRAVTDEPQVGRVHILGKAPRKVSDGSYLSGNWAGAATFSGGPYNGVIGYWKIPTVTDASEPPSEPGTYDATHNIAYDSSSWVGIDGYDPVTYASNDVLQAGVEQYVDTAGVAHYVAWYEWAAPGGSPPAYVYQTNITTVPVSAGDEVVAYISYVGTTAGSVYFGNITTGKYFSRTLAPPSSATFSGGSVEWIMEDPDEGEYSGTALANFTPVVFNHAFACPTAGGVNNPENCDTVNIQAGSGQVLTSVILGNYKATIDFTG